MKNEHVFTPLIDKEEKEIEEKQEGEEEKEEEEDYDDEEKEESVHEGRSRGDQAKEWTDRHTFALMNALGMCLALMNRTCLSIAIVAMVSSSHASPKEVPNGEVCPVPLGANDTEHYEKEGEFDWDEQLQGLILGAFFYGYMPSSFFSGLITEYFGSRSVFGFSVLGISILGALTPFCARTSVSLLVANKILSGVINGPMFPSLNCMMASRIPLELRALYNSICSSGCTFGVVFAMAFGGILCNSDILGGWPSVFYIFGVMGIVWGVLWFVLVKDQPRAGIESSPEYRFQLSEVDWGCLLTSPAFWGLIIFNFGASYGFYTISSEIPTYMSNIQHFNIKNNGLLTSLPYILSIIFIIAWGTAMNHAITNNKISVLASRRLSTAVGMYSAGTAMILMCFADCNSALVVIILCAAVTMEGSCIVGGYLGEQDMCPPSLVSAVKGIVTTVASSPGFIAPLVAGSIVAGNETLSAWRTVFLISASLYIVSGTIYLFCVSVKIQPWIKQYRDLKPDL